MNVCKMHTPTAGAFILRANAQLEEYQRIRIMQNSLVLLLSAVLFIAVLSPVLAMYTISLIVYVVAINPLAHVYRIFRYGIQYAPLESI